jgi:BirA family biotin operon repressor/biotin-[acetyl-CoA-carboxylase] ligase
VAVFTDSTEFAARLMPDFPLHCWGPALTCDDTDDWLRVFLREPRYRARPADAGRPWSHVILSEAAASSNYDRLIDLARDGAAVPDRTVCVAGAGRGFHGFKGRSWAAVPGNLHLSVYLSPRRPIERFEVAFMALAAVSVVDAMDRVPALAGRAGIRWVNDVVLDGAKVAGVLAYTQAQRTTVNAAVLGIGVNVGTRPPVTPTAFVPAVTHLAEHAPVDDLLPRFFRHLLDALDRNYRALLDRGHAELVDRYRSRSVVVGREVAVCAEDSDAEPRVLDRGVVASVGDGLELYLEGRAAPVTRGRIVVEDTLAMPSSDAPTSVTSLTSLTGVTK